MTEKNGLGSEELEGRGQENKEARELDNATHEPSAQVEKTGSYKESEAIEASVTEMVKANGVETGENQISKIDSFTRETQDGLEKDLGATPLPIPNEPNVLDKEQDLGATPLPIPKEPNILDKEQDKGATPLPIPKSEIEYVKAEPAEMPKVAADEEVLLDGKGGDKPTDPDAVEGEVIKFKHFSETETPTEMPPEMSEDEIGQKWPGKEVGEEVEYKFFREAETPAEMPPEVSKEEVERKRPGKEKPGKITGPNPKSEDEEERRER